MREYQAHYPQIVIIEQENSGVSAARNAALRVASGKYIAFCDSDDSVAAGAFHTILEYMETHDAEYVCFAYRYVPAQFTFSADERVKICFAQPEALASPNAVWSFIVSRSILCDHAIWFDETLSYSEDTLFSYRVWLALSARTVNTAVTDAAVYNYRQNPTSVMHRAAADRIPKQMENMHRLALAYSQELDRLKADNAAATLITNTELRIGAAVAVLLWGNLSIGKYPAKTVLAMLREEKLYPYAPQGWKFRQAKTRKNKVIAGIGYFFRWPLCYRLIYGLSRVFRR